MLRDDRIRLFFKDQGIDFLARPGSARDALLQLTGTLLPD